MDFESLQQSQRQINNITKELLEEKQIHQNLEANIKEMESIGTFARFSLNSLWTLVLAKQRTEEVKLEKEAVRKASDKARQARKEAQQVGQQLETMIKSMKEKEILLQRMREVMQEREKDHSENLKQLQLQLELNQTEMLKRLQSEQELLLQEKQRGYFQQFIGFIEMLI